MHSPNSAPAELESDSDSQGSFTIAMFQRAAQPLDGVHPALADLLAHNRDRDAALNEELTRLSDAADTWRTKAETAAATIIRLTSALETVQGRKASFAAESKACRVALAQLQTQYVAFCVSQLNSVHDELSKSASPLRCSTLEPAHAQDGVTIAESIFADRDRRQALRLVG